MTTFRSGFLLTPIRLTLNDLECPIHLKVHLSLYKSKFYLLTYLLTYLAYFTLDERMLWLSKLTMRD